MKLATKFLQAIDLSSKLSLVKRAVRYRVGHVENDAEHSYQVALVAWALNYQYKLNFSDEKILKLALVHDLVEVYAGDVDAHSNKKNQHNKKTKEKEALRQLQKNYSQLKEIIREIEEYEKKESLESQLVNITDKIIPVRHAYHINDQYYKQRKTTADDWINWLYAKVDYASLSPKLKLIVDETVEEVHTKYKKLFFERSAG